MNSLKISDKVILAIGGHVIKTAHEELKTVIKQNKVEMLIHNGGSLFHDFQRSTEKLESHSYPIDSLLEDYSCNRKCSDLVWDWIAEYDYDSNAPEGSVTKLCEDMGIPVLMFTGIACDFWQMFGFKNDWKILGEFSYDCFHELIERLKTPFHYICMGSAVIHPEVFIKAISESKAKDFVADVVDFLDMYRPRTRVAQFGTYYKMTHKEFLDTWATK